MGPRAQGRIKILCDHKNEGSWLCWLCHVRHWACQGACPHDDGKNSRPAFHKATGYHVMRYGGGRYTAVGWYLTHEAAQGEVDRIILCGAWSGMPPKVEGDQEEPDPPVLLTESTNFRSKERR